jgi:hypothetical protein
MLGNIVLKYRRILLLTAVISLSMLLIKGVAAITAANISINKKSSIGKVVWDSHNNLNDNNSKLFFKLNTTYKKNIEKDILINRQQPHSIDFREVLACITTISLQVVSP